MWLFTPIGFLSIVADRKNKNRLLVRARFKGDIEAIFGGDKKVQETQLADYRYRVSLPRNVVAAVIGRMLTETKYDNFKNAVTGHARHGDYMRVWSIMSAAQEREANNEPPTAGSVASLLDDLEFPEGEYGDQP